MRRAVLSGIVVVGLVVAGTQFYLWYETRQLMDRWIDQLSPHVTIRYRRTQASLLGSVGLRELRITRAGETYSIGKLRLVTGGPLALLETLRELRQHRLPTRLSVLVEDLRMRLSSDALRLLPPFSLAHGCGDEWLAPEDFAALGVENIGMDLSAMVAHEAQGVTVDLSLDLQQIAELQLRGSLLPPARGLADWLSEPPMLTELDLRLSDRGFNRRKLAHCGERTGRTLARVIGEHTRDLGDALQQRGVEVGTGLVNGYARFLAVDQGQIQLALKPVDAISLTLDLAHWLPLLEDDGTTLTVNGRAVDDRRISLDSQRWTPLVDTTAAVAASPAPEAGVSENSTWRDVRAITVTDAETAASVAEESVYRTLPHEELDLYIGRRVIIDTVNGNQHRGVIEGFKQGRLTVRIPLRNGSVAIPVRSGGIAQIQVQVQ